MLVTIAVYTPLTPLHCKSPPPLPLPAASDIVTNSALPLDTGTASQVIPPVLFSHDRSSPVLCRRVAAQDQEFMLTNSVEITLSLQQRAFMQIQPLVFILH